MLRPFELVKPHLNYLPQYIDALKQGWSPDNIRLEEAARDELAEIENDAAAFVKHHAEFTAAGGPVKLKDGSTVPRLPGFRRWMWDGDFCGSIGFRCQPGTTELPPTCPGHIGYSVVPSKRQKGYATKALELLLDEIKGLGLDYVDITTDPDNEFSQKVILANHGILVGRFNMHASQGGAVELLFRIHLRPHGK